MTNILTTINHTTVEGLGFVHVFSYSGTDIFKAKGVSVAFSPTGEFTTSKDDRPVQINTIDELKQLIRQ